jgi:hypothetical protein
MRREDRSMRDKSDEARHAPRSKGQERGGACADQEVTQPGGRRSSAEGRRRAGAQTSGGGDGKAGAVAAPAAAPNKATAEQTMQQFSTFEQGDWWEPVEPEASAQGLAAGSTNSVPAATGSALLARPAAKAPCAKMTSASSPATPARSSALGPLPFRDTPIPSSRVDRSAIDPMGRGKRS